MAVEVAFQSYQFLKEHYSKTLLKEREGKGDFNHESSNPKSRDKGGISHNYIHDLESLWWILVWTVFFYEKKPDPTDPTDPVDETSAKWAEAQRGSYNNLFPGDVNMKDRLSFLKVVDTFRGHIENVPPFFQGYAGIIKYLRALLVSEYNEVEKEVPAPVYFSGLSSPDVIHEYFLDKLLKREIENGDVVPIFK